MRWLLVAVVLLIPAAAFAQTQPATLRVATREVKPFVFREGGELQGFSIDLWQEIRLRLGLKSEFVVKPTVQELLDSVKSKETAIGIAAVSITSEREQAFDLSQPMFDAGLQILTPVTTTSGGLFDAIVAGVLTSAALPILAGVIIVILVIAHLVWFFERRNPNGVLCGRPYYPGILEAGWWAASTLATQADQMPRTALARVIAVIWMFSSVVFIAYFTASVTSTLTLQHLHGDINGPGDLRANASPRSLAARPRNISCSITSTASPSRRSTRRSTRCGARTPMRSSTTRRC